MTMTGSTAKTNLVRGFAVPLVRGPLRGSWWQPASGGKIARHLMGTYEREQSDLFQQHLMPGDQVLDIGAAVGYYSLLAARQVGRAGRVVAFEPDPTNLQFLRAHLQWNRLANVEVLPIALADENGTTRFGSGTGTGTGRLCREGAFEVNVRRLDDVAAEHSLMPQHLKIDVEGAEMAVLQGSERLIGACRPKLFLSTHDWILPGVHRACCDLLEAWSYHLAPITGTSVHTASELLCTPR